MDRLTTLLESKMESLKPSIMDEILFRSLQRHGWSRPPKERYIVLTMYEVVSKEISLIVEDEEYELCLALTIEQINTNITQPIGCIFYNRHVDPKKIGDHLKVYISDLIKCELFVVATLSNVSLRLKKVIENLVNECGKERIDKYSSLVYYVNNMEIVHLFDPVSLMEEMRDLFFGHFVKFKSYDKEMIADFSDVVKVLQSEDTPNAFRDVFETNHPADPYYAIKIFSMSTFQVLLENSIRGKYLQSGTRELINLFDDAFDSLNGNGNLLKLNRGLITDTSPHFKNWEKVNEAVKDMYLVRSCNRVDFTLRIMINILHLDYRSALNIIKNSLQSIKRLNLDSLDAEYRVPAGILIIKSGNIIRDNKLVEIVSISLREPSGDENVLLIEDRLGFPDDVLCHEIKNSTIECNQTTENDDTETIVGNEDGITYFIGEEVLEENSTGSITYSIDENVKIGTKYCSSDDDDDILAHIIKENPMASSPMKVVEFPVSHVDSDEVKCVEKIVDESSSLGAEFCITHYDKSHQYTSNDFPKDNIKSVKKHKNFLEINSSVSKLGDDEEKEKLKPEMLVISTEEVQSRLNKYFVNSKSPEDLKISDPDDAVMINSILKNFFDRNNIIDDLTDFTDNFPFASSTAIDDEFAFDDSPTISVSDEGNIDPKNATFKEIPNSFTEKNGIQTNRKHSQSKRKSFSNSDSDIGSKINKKVMHSSEFSSEFVSKQTSAPGTSCGRSVYEVQDVFNNKAHPIKRSKESEKIKNKENISKHANQGHSDQKNIFHNSASKINYDKEMLSKESETYNFEKQPVSKILNEVENYGNRKKKLPQIVHKNTEKISEKVRQAEETTAHIKNSAKNIQNNNFNEKNLALYTKHSHHPKNNPNKNKKLKYKTKKQRTKKPADVSSTIPENVQSQNKEKEFKNYDHKTLQGIAKISAEILRNTGKKVEVECVNKANDNSLVKMPHKSTADCCSGNIPSLTPKHWLKFLRSIADLLSGSGVYTTYVYVTARLLEQLGICNKDEERKDKKMCDVISDCANIIVTQIISSRTASNDIKEQCLNYSVTIDKYLDEFSKYIKGNNVKIDEPKNDNFVIIDLNDTNNENTLCDAKESQDEEIDYKTDRKRLVRDLENLNKQLSTLQQEALKFNIRKADGVDEQDNNLESSLSELGKSLLGICDKRFVPFCIEAWAVACNGMRRLYENLKRKRFISLNTGNLNLNNNRYLLEGIKVWFTISQEALPNVNEPVYIDENLLVRCFTRYCSIVLKCD